MEALGEDPNREGLKETPRRVADFYEEFFSLLPGDPKAELRLYTAEDPKKRGSTGEEMIITKDISFYSLCEHHLLPFFGKAHIVYIPDAGRITGFSQLARMVEILSHRAQLQERFTLQIAEAVQGVLRPKGVLVVVEAEQLCLTMRGLNKPGIVTVTSAVRGTLKNETTRAQALVLLKGR